MFQPSSPCSRCHLPRQSGPCPVSVLIFAVLYRSPSKKSSGSKKRRMVALAGAPLLLPLRCAPQRSSVFAGVPASPRLRATGCHARLASRPRGVAVRASGVPAQLEIPFEEEGVRTPGGPCPAMPSFAEHCRLEAPVGWSDCRIQNAPVCEAERWASGCTAAAGTQDGLAGTRSTHTTAANVGSKAILWKVLHSAIYQI